VSRPRFFTDEDVYAIVAARLRSANFDAVSTPEAARIGESDESQLVWATAEGRTVITFNVRDFARLHNDWISAGRKHSGIVVARQHPVGVILRRLVRLGLTLTAVDLESRLEYLSNW